MQSSINLSPIFVALAITLFIIFVRRMRRGGYGIARISVEHHISSGTSEDLVPVSRKEYEWELRTFLEGKRGDEIDVSHFDANESALTVTREGTGHKVLVSFLLPREANELETFKKGLEAAGHVPMKEDEVKVPLSVRLVILTYEAPSDFESLAPFLDQMLITRLGPPEARMYVSRFKR